MDCPRCSVELTPLSQEESTIHWCPDCGGNWVEVTDLTKILLHANLPALSSSALTAASLFTGVFMIEIIFDLNGVADILLSEKVNLVIRGHTDDTENGIDQNSRVPRM